MKATASQDGTLRFDLRIKHRVSADDIKNAVCYKVVNEVEFYTPRREGENIAMSVESALRGLKSRRACLEAVEFAFNREGESYWSWGDNVYEEARRELSEQARVIVFKAFPELRNPNK